MSRDGSHTQCRLQKGNSVQTTWLPTEFANKGKYVKLKERGTTEWDDGWLVVETFTTLDSAYVNDRSQDHKHLPSLERQKKGKR